MLKGATARRYAGAVFEIAQESEKLDRWLEDLRVIAEYFGNRRLTFVLREPKIPFTRKELIVDDLLADKVQPEALNLAKLLVERELVEVVPALRDQFERLYNDYRGQAYAQVTTAIPLDDELRDRVKRELQEITGKRIILREKVDPAILGGAIARVGDTLIDGSLLRRFTLLRRQIIEGGAFGGPNDGADGSLADLFGPGGAGGGADSFVITPTRDGVASSNGSHANGANGSEPGNNGSTANDVAPRAGDAPHLAPRANGNSDKNGNSASSSRSSAGPRSAGEGSRMRSNSGKNGNTKRRRR